MEKKRNAKGEGSFILNPDGTVTHRKSVGYKANGRRKVLTVTAATKTACIREMKKKEAEWKEEKASAHIQMGNTVAELCHSHLKYQIENGDLKPKSIDRREGTIINQIEKYELGSMQLQAVSTVEIEQHIRLLVAERKISESSIVKVIDVLNAAYVWAVLRGDLEKNPVQAIKQELIKKLKKMSVKQANEADVVVLSTEEVERFSKEAAKRNADGAYQYFAGNYLLLLLHTGMRCGEMIALRWRDVDWENGLLTIEKSASMARNRSKQGETDNNFVMIEGSTKNQKARVIQLTQEAQKVLQALHIQTIWTGPDDLITPTKTGKMNTASNLEHRMKVIMKNAGLDGVQGGLHIFRKTFATQMYEKGARVEEIAAYIGDLESTTRKYYIAIRKKVMADGMVKQVVKLPDMPKYTRKLLKGAGFKNTG